MNYLLKKLGYTVLSKAKEKFPNANYTTRIVTNLKKLRFLKNLISITSLRLR